MMMIFDVLRQELIQFAEASGVIVCENSRNTFFSLHCTFHLYDNYIPYFLTIILVYFNHFYEIGIFEGQRKDIYIISSEMLK